MVENKKRDTSSSISSVFINSLYIVYGKLQYIQLLLVGDDPLHEGI